MNHTTYRIAAFNQGGHLDAAHNPASEDGACHMFALKWCSLIMKGQGNGAAARMRTVGETDMESRVKYAAFGRRWGSEGNTTADGGFAKMWGTQVHKVETLNSAALVHSHVRSESLTGFIYSFWWGREGHSIGVYRPKKNRIWPGYVSVFEPNYGEYRMKKSRFGDWVRWLQAGYGKGATTRHQLRHMSNYTAPVVAGGIKLPGM